MRWMWMVGLVGACAAPSVMEGPAPAESPDDETSGPDETAAPLDVFDEAEATWEVPALLLLAIANQETGVEMVVGEEEFPGWAPAYGVMALRGERLVEGAALAGFDPETVRTDRRANVLAAAALLRSWADELGLGAEDDLGDWAPVVARYAGVDEPAAVSSYVHDGVYAKLAAGFEVEGEVVHGRAFEAAWPRHPGALGAADRSYAVWRPSPNYNSRSGTTPQLVVIHTCEGSYSGCWGWLVNSSSGVSAHYVVNDSGSEVSQLVNESNRAWHVGASYDCTLNGNTLCAKNGGSVNTFSVGIEHAGYGSQSSWATGLLDKSAQLTCDITKTHNIPRDSYHIVAHGRLQPYNRTDPGPNWPWADYLARVNAKCNTGGGGGGGTPATSFVIDSNNGRNNTALRKVEVSSSWTASSATPGYYGTGYWVGPVAAVSDPAHFKFKETATGCYKVDAWWTAGTNRSTAATFIAWDASGKEVGRKTVNQQTNGGRWNTLGTWKFTSGWNDVGLSRWTTGKVVLADALRFTPASCP